MAQVSEFSTVDNFNKLQGAIQQIDRAIKEAQLAQQAGVPGADQLLATAEDARARTLQIMNTYFPSGTAPSE